MAERKVEPGEIVYHEGDVPDFAYVVVSGKIELIDNAQGSETQIKIIDAGKTFGENALFDPWALRPFTAKAVDSSVLNSMSVEEFKSMLSQCPRPLMPYFMPAFERMKSTKVKEKPIAVAILTDITKITVSPASDHLRAQLKSVELPVSRLPFRIGGFPEGGETKRQDQLHMNIASHSNPLRISRQHCEIVIENKNIVVSDLASRFNTKVNGVIIGRGHGLYTAALQKGVNDIVLSPSDELYRLSIRCD